MADTPEDNAAAHAHDLALAGLSEELSYGQRAVGLAFNPSGDDNVSICKQLCADVIDKMDRLRRESSDSEQKRLATVAITEMQTAQMWAVKALTWRV